MYNIYIYIYVLLYYDICVYIHRTLWHDQIWLTMIDQYLSMCWSISGGHPLRVELILFLYMTRPAKGKPPAVGPPTALRSRCDMHATCIGHAWQGCKWWSHINIFILVKAITRYSYGMTLINLDCRTPVTGTSLFPSQHWAVSWRNCTTIIYHPDLGTHSGSRHACSLIFPGAHDHS